MGDTRWQGTGRTPAPFTLNSKRGSEKLEVTRMFPFQKGYGCLLLAPPKWQ